MGSPATGACGFEEGGTVFHRWVHVAKTQNARQSTQYCASFYVLSAQDLLPWPGSHPDSFCPFFLIFNSFFNFSGAD